MKYILLIIIFGFIGYYFYKLKPFNYTQNCRPIIDSLHEELINLTGTIETSKIKQRKEEIKQILSQFYGLV